MASLENKQAISEAASQYAKPEGKVFQYGTAGVGNFAIPILSFQASKANQFLAISSSV
jgi:hypothetical protein